MPQQPSQALSPGRFFPADPKILVSLAVFLAGVAIPFLVTPPEGAPEETLGQHIAFGYVFWALFWGAPAVWRVGRKIGHWMASVFASFGCLGIGIAVAFIATGGWLYCLLGGGIYQFLKHWWSVTPRTS